MARGNDSEFELSQEQGSKIRLEGSRAESDVRLRFRVNSVRRKKVDSIYSYSISTYYNNKNQLFKEKSEIPLQNN